MPDEQFCARRNNSVKAVPARHVGLYTLYRVSIHDTGNANGINGVVISPVNGDFSSKICGNIDLR